MTEFPRTMVGGISMPRLICGSNWLLGFSHTSKAQDRFIKEHFDTAAKMADVIEVFARAGCNAYMSSDNEISAQALKEVEQRTGREMIWVMTPSFTDEYDLDSWKRKIEYCKKLGATFCFPHQCSTDPRLDLIHMRLSDSLIEHLNVVRQAGLLPGLSTHNPYAVPCADNCEADVVSYIQIYNAAGFLCQVETDWIEKIIHEAKQPVMTIKPLAAGRLMPSTGLPFVWNTIRDCDMVTIGCMTPYEAEEVIEISLANLENRRANVELQFTRSKKGLAEI